MRRAEDCPPYQRSGFDEAKPAAQMWMRQSGGCKISAAKKQSGRHSKSRVGRRRVVQANCPARSGMDQTLADMEVVPQTEPKAVLEHRAPKTSLPILHTRGVESKVGRVPHVRDAPPSVHPERSGGQRTARPTNPVVTARATLGRSKFCIGRRAFVRAGLRARLRPAPNIGRRGNRPSNRFWFTAQTRSRGGKVGRAVHCAPWFVVQT